MLTLKVVKQALGRVAELVTLSIEKHPAGQGGGAVGPRILHSQGAVASIPLAGVGVTVLITIAIPGFLCTLGIQASPGLRAERDGLLTVAALRVSRALAVIVRGLRMRAAAAPVLAGGAGTAWVCLAFLSHRQLGAIAPRTRRCLDALLPLLAFHLSTGTVAVELTFCSRITRGALADEALGHVAGHRAGAAVLARLPRAHVNDTLTVPASESASADAPVVVGELHAVQAAARVAGVGEALVDVALAALPREALGAQAAEPPDLVDALPPVEAARSPRVRDAVIHVLLTQPAPGSWWAGALEVVDQVDAGAPVLAGLELALIHLVLAVDPLVPSHTLAVVSAQVVPAGGSVLAGAGLALIQLHLAVAARVAHLALAVVAAPHVEAVTRVLAQLVHGDSSL